MNVLKKIKYKIWNGLDGYFREYEIIVINELLKKLDEYNRNQIIQQIKNMKYVAHDFVGYEGASLTFNCYYSINKQKKPEEYKINLDDLESFKVYTYINNQKIKFTIDFYENSLLSIETRSDIKSMPKEYKKLVCKIEDFEDYKITQDIKVINSKFIYIK